MSFDAVTVADLRGDAPVEIAAVSRDGFVRVFDGTLKPIASRSYGMATNDPCGLVINDIDGDGKNEIVAFFGRSVYVLDGYLNELWRWSAAGNINELQVADFDGDGISEIVVSADRVYVVGGSPDSDMDGLTDAQESMWGLDASRSDSDGDGIPDSIELRLTNGMPADTDGDGIIDALDTDSDNDGLPDWQEDRNGDGVLDPGETNPYASDTDGDGMPDKWEIDNGLSPRDPGDAQEDPDHDGLTNLQEYLLGKNPRAFDNLRFGPCQRLPDGGFQLTVFGEMGRNYTLQASTNLVNWVPLFNFACTNWTMYLADPFATNYLFRFYRIGPLTSGFRLQLGLGSDRPLTSNGFELSLTGPAGLNYRVDASIDLVNWIVLTNFVSTGATMNFRDSAATNFSQRFYRAVAP
jgi:hypothetical protein